ncbi:hypothetical protein ABLT31_33160 [Ammoniphilus sp. 3BR4]
MFFSETAQPANDWVFQDSGFLDQSQGAIIGVSTFGASAPGEKIMKEFGFAVEHVVARVESILSV